VVYLLRKIGKYCNCIFNNTGVYLKLNKNNNNIKETKYMTEEKSSIRIGKKQ